MCGLVGMAGNIVEQDKKALKALLRLDTFRGEDSTGLAVITVKDSEVILRKKVGAPDAGLFKEDIFDNKLLYNGPWAKVFIGHNRAATKGSISDANAHPFYHDGVVGAHNGTLRGPGELDDFDKFEVDSEAIFYNLSQYDAKSVINSIHGAYALVWHDDSDDTLNVIRNNERPLYYTRRVDGDVYYWASTELILKMGLSIANVSHGPILEFTANKLYKLDVSDTSPSKFRPKKWEISENYMFGYSPPVKTYQHHHGSSSKVNASNSMFNQGGSNSNVIPFVGGIDSSATLDEIKEMKLLDGKEIEFKFAGIKTGVSKSKYIAAFPTDINKDYDIRIYGEKNKNWTKWQSKLHKAVFTGKVKRVADHYRAKKRETYLVIDLRTIKEIGPLPSAVVPVNTDTYTGDVNAPYVPPTMSREELMEAIVDKINAGTAHSNVAEERDDNNYYEGYLGRWLNKEEYTECTKKGCAHCSADASDYDQDMIFINHDQFLCGKCSDLFPNYAMN